MTDSSGTNRQQPDLKADSDDRIGGAEPRRRHRSPLEAKERPSVEDQPLSEMGKRMPDVLAAVGLRLERILATLKNPLAVAGLVIFVAGTIVVRSISPDQIAVQVVIGVIGIDF